MTSDDKTIKEKLLEIVKSAIRQDAELREQHKVGEKFRFIHERLENLLTYAHEHLAEVEEEEKQEEQGLAEDETMVYVHLFNAQGSLLESWQKMFSPSYYYEYSINRPVFESQRSVESFIRNKPDKMQHGYIVVGVKQEDIKSVEGVHEGAVKVREGRLDAKKLIMFVHNEKQYRLSDEGFLELIEQSS